MEHTIGELQRLQGLPLKDKVEMTKERIRAWVDHFGLDHVAISFSGGKDSTVLLHIAREMFPDIKAVFSDTGLEYPEIREFVKSFDNVDWVKPKMNFRQVIEKYGYPLFSKEISESVEGARKYLTSIINEENAFSKQASKQNYRYFYDKVTGQGKYDKSKKNEWGGTITNIAKSKELANILNERMVAKTGGQNQRLALLLGMLTRDKEHPIQVNIPDKDRSQFSQERYQFLLEAPFEISNKCCNRMKKDPLANYSKKNERYYITAQMASESRLRTQKWLQHGCNAYDAKKPISNPMSFWVDQDVLLFIKTNNTPICSVYGEIKTEDEIDGQMTIGDVLGEKELFDLDRPTLKTTGCNRTGCLYCGFGCHLEKPGEGRFERLKVTHPQIYDYIMRPWDENGKQGLNYKEIIDWINEHNGKGTIIRY